MGVLDQFEPTLCAPLCMTSVMTLSVSLEMAYIILTDPHLAPAPGVGKVDPGLEPEPWGMPRAVAGLGQTLGAWRILHLAFLAFILGNVVGNLCLFIRRNPSIRGVFLANQAVGQGWSYCYVCESHVPQRCSHCHDCKVCVLRRDHHCVLFGQCVGHANHRFFLCCLLHMWLGLLYAISLNADIFLELLQEGLSLHSLFLLFIPWAMLITDSTPHPHTRGATYSGQLTHRPQRPWHVGGNWSTFSLKLPGSSSPTPTPLLVAPSQATAGAAKPAPLLLPFPASRDPNTPSR
ncbi:probable palmitoyltransferase ZDHHC24 isoform X2 [Pristis pectinata]|uniref:probable palmitoyltransferase ZDHHC24 isoform X2 n=1 Tax=Pristis pectinata TaxID=685728 RepID=UPI00223D5AB2|nr:probable palmitoyltransferase ZDHHC24 isoform X2 [Pristis pectinata]